MRSCQAPRFWKFVWRFNPPSPPHQKGGGCTLCKGNSVVTANKNIYTKRMENLLIRRSWKSYCKKWRFSKPRSESRKGYRVRQLTYVWFWTCVRWDVRTFFPMIFKKFSKFFRFFKNLLLYISPLIYLFVLGRDRFFTVYICFIETPFFNFSYKIFNRYFSLPLSTCQFRVSVSK